MFKCFKILLFLFVYNAFSEEINLESYASGFDTIPIAILKFRPLESQGITENKPWEIIAQDLDFSGRFKVIGVDSVDTALFREHNIGLFIDGEYTLKGSEVLLNCYLHDAAAMNLLNGKKYRGKEKFMRSMAHRYSNEVLEMILNEKPFFTSRIVFVEDMGISKNLFVMDYDGYNIRKITNSATVNIFPAFIDSQNLIWTAFFRGKPDIYRGSIRAGSYKIFLYSRYVETSPSVSEVTGKIAYASSRNGSLDIYTCDSDGTNIKQLTFGKSVETSPCWSPNGYQIAFTSDKSGRPQIYIMDADGVNKHVLFPNGRYQDSPAWSPKGDKIVFSCLQDGKFDIWIAEADGSEAAPLTSCAGNNEYPSWSPDGSHIVFASKRGGKSDLYTIRKDGTDLKRLTKKGNVRMPDWSK